MEKEEEEEEEVALVAPLPKAPELAPNPDCPPNNDVPNAFGAFVATVDC